MLKFWQSYNFAQLPCVDKQTDKLKESGENFKKCEHFQCNDLDISQYKATRPQVWSFMKIIHKLPLPPFKWTRIDSSFRQHEMEIINHNHLP